MEIISNNIRKLDSIRFISLAASTRAINLTRSITNKNKTRIFIWNDLLCWCAEDRKNHMFAFNGNFFLFFYSTNQFDWNRKLNHRERAAHDEVWMMTEENSHTRFIAIKTETNFVFYRFLYSCFDIWLSRFIVSHYISWATTITFRVTAKCRFKFSWLKWK